MIDFTSFIDSVADLPAGSLRTRKRRVVAYHDSCQGLNALGLGERPRRILGEVLGHEVRIWRNRGSAVASGELFVRLSRGSASG